MFKEVRLRINQDNIGRNTAWMLAGLGGKSLFQGIYFIILARALGVEGFGIYMGALALVFILAPFAGWGSGRLLIMHVARDPEDFPVYWGNALVTILVSSSILCLIILLLGFFLLPNIPLKLLMTLAVAEFFFGRITETSADAFQAFEFLDVTAKINMTISFLKLGAVFLFSIFTYQNTPLLWGWWYLAGTFISALIGLILVHIRLGRPKTSFAIFKNSFVDGFYFAVGISSFSVYHDVDKTMLVRLANPEAAGIYAVAYRIISIVFVPVLAFLNATFARFFKHGQSGIQQSFLFAKRLLPIAVSYGVIGVLLILLFAPLVPYLLGEAYQEAVEAVRLLSVLVFFQCIHYFIADALTGAGYQKVRSIIQMGAALFNVLVNLWLIPLYSWKGAAWASIVTEALLIIALWLAVSILVRRQNLSKEGEECTT